MGIIHPFFIYTLFSNVALSILFSCGLRGDVGFAFYRGARKAKLPKRSPLTPQETARLAELEHALVSEQSLEQAQSVEDIHLDRNIGASYKPVRSHAIEELVDVHGDDAEFSEDERQQGNLIPEISVGNVPASIRSTTEGTVFDEALRAAEEWESNNDRFRNVKGEVVDNITDNEMVRQAQALQSEERHESPSVKQLFSALEDKSQVKEANNWKDLVHQFEIDTDASQCCGCGIRLQCRDTEGKGFVDVNVLRELREADGRPLCKRCSSMRSGVIFKDEAIAVGESAVDAARETVAILRNALSMNESRNVTLVYMMDALDMHFEDGLSDLIISRRNRRKAETHFYIVINKVDLLPPHSRKRLLMYVHKFIKSRAPELKLKPRHIFLMSSLKGGGVNLFLSVLLHMAYRLHSKVFFVGATNTGKSTFINRLSKVVKQNTNRTTKMQLLSTSVIPGTTLHPLRIDTGPGFNLYDTPGIVVTDSLTSHLTASELKMAVPSSVGSTKPFRLGAGYSLFLGPFVRIDVVEGRPFFFSPHVSKRVPVVMKRTDRVEAFMASRPFGDVRMFYSTANTDSRDSAIGREKHYGMDPLKREYETVKHKVRVVGEGWEKATTELCIKGLGFVTIAGALELYMTVETMRGVSVYMREPLMPFDGLPFLRRKVPLKRK
ncbi:putative membrane protein [Babesia divergens]|uniref:Membrane protein n=1 Tax=Babesia divergens TaxID=32595 RepID=A0AAD9GJA6_BABDI|nr:putative membrane protein [Babesia divergens]